MKNIICLFLLFPFSVFAELDCEPLDPRQQVGMKASTSIDGSAQTLFKAIKGNVDYKSLTEKTIRNLYEDYPNADKIVINGKMMYFLCTYLNSAQDLSSDEKFNKLTEFMRLMLVDSEKKDSTKENKKISEKLPVFEQDDIVTALKSCSLKGKKLKCFLSITSLEDKPKFAVYANYDSRHSKIILPTGKVIFANKVTFFGRENKHYVRGGLISSIAFEAILSFNGVLLEENKVPLLDVRYQNSYARLKNITINR